MQLSFNGTQPSSPNSSAHQASNHSPKHGFSSPHAGHGLSGSGSSGSARSASPLSSSGSSSALAGFDVEQFAERLRRLNSIPPPNDAPPLRGKNVINYETNFAPRQNMRLYTAFHVVPSVGNTPSGGTSINDLSNEVLTHILSYLSPESYNSLTLVSRRFYNLVRDDHAWQIAFRRFFSGKNTLKSITSGKMGMIDRGSNDDSEEHVLLPFGNNFARLTEMPSWQSEYFLRSQLIHSLVKGKPGVVAGEDGELVKLKAPMETYDSSTTGIITSIHADFAKDYKFKAIHGAAELGRSSRSNPGFGQVSGWGLTDSFEIRQAPANHALFTDEQTMGYTAVPNVMDVSVSYGSISGEGFPGGRPFYRPMMGKRARYLDLPSHLRVHELNPEVPEISPENGISSVWIAKSPSVLDATRNLVGIMTGSTLGVVTTYMVSGSRKMLEPGDMTARWVLCPGVPIVALKVDDGYSFKRHAAGRVWAVALNALGEIFYLRDTPSFGGNPRTVEEKVLRAWLTGRSTEWHLVGPTLRQPKLPQHGSGGAADSSGRARNPRSSPESYNLAHDVRIEEAANISEMARREVGWFKARFKGWDMRRKLEVDFAGDNGRGAGEAVFVVDCGDNANLKPGILRFIRSGDHEDSWHRAQFAIRSPFKITATALDSSLHTLKLRSEDPLHSDNIVGEDRKIPGGSGRARFLAAGLDNGCVLLWNARHEISSQDDEVNHIKTIDTGSASVTCLALSALYLVHGGRDGLVQAWDMLGSTLEPLKTILNAGTGAGIHLSRHHFSSSLPNSQVLAARKAAGSIFLDPDPTKLRGIVSFGAFLRFWCYGSTGDEVARRRQAAQKSRPEYDHRRKSDKMAVDRSDYADEELERVAKQKLGMKYLGDLTEEEALLYAQMISKETFAEEQRRIALDATEASTSAATKSRASDAKGVASNNASSPTLGPSVESDEDMARRLAEEEEANAAGYWPSSPTSDDSTWFPIKYKQAHKKKGKKQGGGSASKT